MVKNRTKFFQFLADLEPYLIEFDSEKKIKEKNYLQRVEIGETNWRPVICITHNGCTFSVNN